MRFACGALWWVAGCHFVPGAAGRDGALADVELGDSTRPRDGAADAPLDTGSGFAFCNPADLDLRACYAFDGNANDGSSYGNNATTGGVITYMGGVHGSAVLTAASSIVVSTNNGLSISTMTLKASIHPTALPTGGARAGIIDCNGYRLFVESGGTVRCALNAGVEEVITTATVPLGMWTRVACTYDVTAIRVYFNGIERSNASFNTGIDGVVGNLTIGQNEPNGDNFDGLIDEVQIWGSIVAP